MSACHLRDLNVGALDHGLWQVLSSREPNHLVFLLLSPALLFFFFAEENRAEPMSLRLGAKVSTIPETGPQVSPIPRSERSPRPFLLMMMMMMMLT